MLNKSVMNFIGCDAGYEEADIVLYGAPFDSTTSFRPGTRFAGQAVRNDSYGLETYSPYQDRDLEDLSLIHICIIGRAMAGGFLDIEAVNIRDYAFNKHQKVDDYPYGGGAGMLMQAEPVYLAYESVEKKIGYQPRVIYLTPQGKVFNQEMAKDFAEEKDLVCLGGHYEGIDERVLEEIFTDYVSIGDYVLTGGELPAMVMMDSISRMVPGVLTNQESGETESFSGSLLEYPQYSRPETWHEKKAVSYTHLDVYKRQVLNISFTGMCICRMEESISATISTRTRM